MIHWTASTRIDSGFLREIFTAAGGIHEDFGAYDVAMAAERRAAVLIAPARVYN